MKKQRSKIIVYNIVGFYLSRQTNKLTKHGSLGFFKTLKAARRAIEGNYCGLDEANYNIYIMIEAYTEGVYTLSKCCGWYKWENQKYQKCEDPRQEKQQSVCNYAQ